MKRNIARIILLFLLLVPAAQAQGDGDDWNIDRLMASMAAEALTRVNYREEKRFVFLAQELVSNGVLRYEEPGTLVREVTAPDRAVYTSRGSAMVIEEPGRERREVDLSAYPVALVFMETFKAVLLGDLQGLNKHYRLELTGNRSSWSLRMTPADEKVREMIESITLQGRGGLVKRIETVEVGGDSTLMVIEPHGE